MGKFYIGYLAYNGSNYFGWQKQKDVQTIQETIFDTLRGIYPLGRIDVKATSRTDRGVHALGQVVKFLIPRREDANIVFDKVNRALPEDIQFTQLERINKSFKVTYMSLFKEYLYFFNTGYDEVDLPFVGHIDAQFSSQFDFELLKQGCDLFKGKHDFRYFQNKSDVKSDFVREIYECSIIKAIELFPDAKFPENTYCLHIKGSGFLKQMVRIIMGSLVSLASGECTLDDMKKALRGESVETGRGQKLGFIAPPSGLFLKHIQFPEFKVNDDTRAIVHQENYLGLYPAFELWMRG